ncbi:MAG: hypothetical protein FWC19_06020 [Treponema sp.]|nr:hypothetical protein [Treponema sp.]MCL2272343.1 hypothetical protein [Treponema sp.]
MIFLFFFLKFKSQLKRTRPDIIRQLDETLIRAINDAGGKITGDRFVISAIFDEESIGFWLDIYILIENLKKIMENSREYFGYSLVITSKIPNSPELLSRFLANHSGVFIDDKSAKKFVPYAKFEKPSQWLKGMKRHKYSSGSFYRINELKNFNSTIKDDLDLQDEITRLFEQSEDKNIMMIAFEYAQARSGLYNYCRYLNNDFPVLSISFGSIGIGSIVDTWSLKIRTVLDAEKTKKTEARQNTELEEIDRLWELLFRERIRDEVSEYTIRCIRRFLYLIMRNYLYAALRKKRTPILVLENMNFASKIIADIILETMEVIKKENIREFTVFGIADNEISQDKLRNWETLFKKTLNIDDKNRQRMAFPRLSTELWEIIYSISYFGKYFSPEIFTRLFEESDVNTVMINRAFSILVSLRLIDNIYEPKIINRHMDEYSAAVLEQRAGKVKELVCSRLLSWAKRQNLNPCFRLLSIISGLDGLNNVDETLLLKSFLSDVINNTVTGIKTSMTNGQFTGIVQEKETVMRYIFDTSMALHSGGAEDIAKVFCKITDDNINKHFESSPVLKAQIYINFSSWYLGKNERNEALKKAKEAVLIGQDNNAFCLPQAYRMFSLVCLLQQKPLETIEYIGFALSNAEKIGNYNELSISYYYAAAAQFLYGNIYSASKFIQKAIEKSLEAGRCEWADRSYFLEGRIKFELGYYQNALEIFEFIKYTPFGKRSKEKDDLLSAWIYRSKVYIGYPDTPKPAGSSFDNDFFEIEAAYFSGEYRKVLELANSIRQPAEKNFLYTEQADWSSGFAQCEYLYFTNGEIQNRMICLFYSLALCKVSAGGIDDAIQGIQNIIRDENLCEIDPWDAFYFFAKYMVLEQTGADMVDLSTAVSMAFKRLQRRAGRIEDIETRRQYLNGPRWNQLLSVAAKEFKLI